MKNEAWGFCDGGTDSFFRMKYRLFVTMQYCLPVAAVSGLDLLSWLKVMVKLLGFVSQGGVWPCAAQKGREVWHCSHQKLLLLCP